MPRVDYAANDAAAGGLMREEFWFHFPFRVRYSEVDAQAVVFNAHYLTYFDTAITEYFRALGYDYLGEVARTGIDFHTVKTVVEYKAPIRFDEDIEVCVRVARIGRSSINLALAIFAKGSEKGAEDLRATGEVIWVATDQKAHKPVAVAEDLRALIASREKALAQG
jgi:acyl-CoA thioester hydrolase